MKKTIVNFVKKSRTFQLLFQQEEDFNHGRAFMGKVTSAAGEVNTVLLVIIGWSTLRHKILELSALAFFSIIAIWMFGKFYRKSYLLEKEQRAKAANNPLGNRHLAASDFIVNHEKEFLELFEMNKNDK